MSSSDLSFDWDILPHLSSAPRLREAALQSRSNSSLSTSSSLKENAPLHSPSSTATSVTTLSAKQQVQEVNLASFEILKYLGAGSFAQVYLVRHIRTQKLLALKTMRKSSILKYKKKNHVFSELRILERLASQKYQCPYICPLVFAFHSPNKLYLAFEFLSGGELYFHLRRRGRMPESLSRFYACEIVLALGYLHSLSICYRDLKPENLVLDSMGHLNLIDFGLSVDLRKTEKVSGSAGTTDYLAPEALLANEADQGLALDWWAFGMVVFEMLTGLPPWSSPDKVLVVQGILHGLVDDLDFGTMSCSARDLISSLLIRDPASRLGAGGTREVMSHPFFSNVDWIRVAKRGYEPPFIPPRDLDEDDIPGLCNFDAENVSLQIKQPSPLDFQNCTSDDEFEGFCFQLLE